MFVGVVATPAPALAASVDCSRGVNLSYETPVLSQDWRGVPQADVPGWSSSSGVIEIWQSGFLGAVAPDGAQLSELQANDNSPSWQDIATLPGDRIEWSFFHRGRQDTDTVVVRMGSPSSLADQATISTGTESFIRYSGTYVVPDGQTTTRFMLDPQDPGSVGNLVDAVRLVVDCGVSVGTSIRSESDVDGSGDVSVGDEITFAYEVVNDGTASLGIAVAEGLGDGVSCPAALLTPGSSMECTATHVVTQADVDAGSVASDVRVTGTDATDASVTASDALDVDVEQRPSVSLVKTGSVDPTVVAPTTRIDAGDAVTYAFGVTNTGNVTLESIGIVDPLTEVSCPDTDIAPGAVAQCAATYLLGQSDLDAGRVDNSATVTASPPAGDDVTASDSISTILDMQPSLSVAKTTGSRTYATPGDKLVYSIVVTNDGNATLSDVSVSDDAADSGSLSCEEAPISELLPGRSVNCTAVRTVTQADIDEGAVSNTAFAEGQDPDANTVLAEDTVTISATQSPSVDITKSAAIDSTVVGPLDRVDAGDRVNYTLSVTNTGNVTLSDLIVSDPTVFELVCDAASVAPGASVTCTGVDTIEQADIDAGDMSNTANVAATAPAGDTVDATTTITTSIDQAPDVAMSKTAEATSNGDGWFSFAYVIGVSNTGNTTLTDLQIEDDLLAAFGELPFSVTSLSSDHLSVNPAYDGVAEIDILTGDNRLSPGESARVDLGVRVFTEGSAGPFANEASIVAASGVGAVTGVGASDTVSTGVDVAFDLTIDVASQRAVAPGQNATWTIVTKNTGPSVAPGPVVVTSVLDNRLAFVSASGSGWTCAHNAGTVTCVSAGDVVAGSSSTIELVTLVNADAGVTISITATVSAADPANESTFVNNTSVASLQAEALPLTGSNLDTMGWIGVTMMLLGFILVGVARIRRRPIAD